MSYRHNKKIRPKFRQILEQLLCVTLRCAGVPQPHSLTFPQQALLDIFGMPPAVHGVSIAPGDHISTARHFDPLGQTGRNGTGRYCTGSQNGVKYHLENHMGSKRVKRSNWRVVGRWFRAHWDNDVGTGVGGRNDKSQPPRHVQRFSAHQKLRSVFLASGKIINVRNMGLLFVNLRSWWGSVGFTQFSFMPSLPDLQSNLSLPGRSAHCGKGINYCNVWRIFKHRKSIDDIES